MRGEFGRLVEVMHRLRGECPWDAEQTHASLVSHLIEEAHEAVEAIETGTDADLREELGDLLLQVVFHSEIASERGAFTVDDVAGDIADKLIRRHEAVFGDGAAPAVADVRTTWEQRKRAEKGRTSALDGIPPMPGIARAAKVISRARSHGVQLSLPDQPIAAEDVGTEIVALVARAQASGVDADQAVRSAVRGLETQVRESEGAVRESESAPIG